MLTLQLVAQTASQSVDPKRSLAFGQIQELELSQLLDRPPIEVHPIYFDEAEISQSIRSDAGFSAVQEYMAKLSPETAGDAYIQLSRLMRAQPDHFAMEFFSFLKADLMLAAQLAKQDRELNFALDDYELAIRSYPRSESVPRALYQTAFIRLQLGLYPDVELVVDRAIREFPNNKYLPQLYLLRGEQALRSEKYVDSLRDFSVVVRRFPSEPAAAEASFRRAFILFRDRKFSEALETYKNLERFHPDTLQYIQMKRDGTNPDRLLDRVYYAETLYLTKNYSEASNMFQNLANLFPRHEITPFLWIRFADTFFARDQIDSALRLYEFVRTEPRSGPLAKAVALMRVADTYFLTNNLVRQVRVPTYYEEALDLLSKAKNIELSALISLKRAVFFFESQSYVRAKRALSHFVQEFPTSQNIAVGRSYFIRVLELEILDHHKAGDYLAALSVFLMQGEDGDIPFRNTDVLLKLAESAHGLMLYDKAIEILNRIIYLESSSEARQRALLKLIHLLIEQGELRQASERLRRFNFAYPRSKFQHLYDKAWGDLYFKLGNDRRAIRHYEDTLSSVKKAQMSIYEVRDVYTKLGELYAKVQLPVKAIEYYSSYLDLYSDSEKIALETVPMTDRDRHLVKVAQYRIADLLFDMKDYVKALQAYQRVSEAVTDEPFRSHALYRIGESYLALGDRHAAIEAFSRVQSQNDSNIWVRAAQSYVKSVEMEVKYGIRIFN